jgi:hypothetical protein
MEWTWFELMRQNSLGVHWSVGALGAAVGAVVWGSWLMMRAVLRRRGLLDQDPTDPAPRLPPAPDPRAERLAASGLPVSRGMDVVQPPTADLGAILGTGTPMMGPAPPSISFEPDENVERVGPGALAQLPPWLKTDEE